VECKKCGLCCLFVEVNMKHNSFDKEWMDFITTTRPDNFIFANNNKTLKIVQRCKYLKDNQCSIYENRPEKCKNYFCKA
jgi:Fe-S-cluster containining protein